MTSPGHFPYVHSGEPDLPAYLRVRAEGLPLSKAIFSGLSYLRKYFQPKTSAPIEELVYFEHQRSLLRWLMNRSEPVGDSLRLALVGDIMWLRNGWESFLSPGVREYLNAHPVVLGNLESPISGRFPVPSFWPDYFTYNSHPGLITSFRRADGISTFSALSTANNHSLDRGDEGLADTLAFLDSQGIAHSGVRAHEAEKPYVTFQAGGITFGFYAACWGLNNPALVSSSRFHIEVLPGLVPRVRHPVDLSRIRQTLADMEAEGVDVKIIALHWGHEFEFYPCPDHMQIGREIVRAGADVVMGSHPHVLQPLEICFVNGYEKRLLAQGLDLPALHPGTGCLVEDGTGVPRKALIAYSLGNFATAMFTLHCQLGMVLSLTLARDPESGRVDWSVPEIQLVHMVQCDPSSGQRRLMLLETYLRERERAGDPAEKVRAMARYLEGHLLGVE